MPVLVRASYNKVSWDKFEDRRQLLENARNANLRRLRSDIDRIAKRETEFAKKVFETIVPVKLVWDEEAWKRVQEFSPIKVEVTKEPEPVEKKDTEIVDM